ncbi:autotransporter outer membrane beta-barrel domain-containing protein, partial [Helicobacter brantae]
SITLSNSGANNATIGENGTLTLQGENNQLTSVSSTTSGTLSLDGASNENGVSASVSNAITGNSTTLNFNGRTDKKAEMTLNASGNFLKAITLGSNAVENKLILTQGDTSIESAVNVGASQALAFDLANGTTLALSQGLSSSNGGTSLFNVKDSASSTINGNITLSNNGVNNVTIGNNGTLTLQGENNQLTSVSSTTSGTLSLDGASNENGVTASVSNAITGNSTTLDFNGANGKKAEMTLSDGGNFLKAITLGSNAVENKLILTQGDTSIESAVSVEANQALAFDLGDGVELLLSKGMQSVGKSYITIPSNSSASISGENGNIEIDTINLGNIQGRLRSLNVYSTLTLNNPQTTTIKNFNPISDTSSIILKNGEVVIANPLSINQDKILNFTFNQPSTLTFEKNISNNGVLRFNFNESGILVLKEVSQENSKAIFEINLGNENNSGVNASIEDNTPISNLSINIHSKNTALQYGDTQGLIFSQGTNEITFMGDQTSLEWKNLNGAKLSSIQTTGGITNVYFNGVSTEIDKNNYALLDCGLENNGGELNIVLGSTTQNSIQSSHAKINNDIITTNNAKTKISFGSEGNILFLGGNTNTISAIENYSNSTNNTISLANIDEFGNDSVGNSTRGEYKTLLINGDNEAIKGENLHFVVYVNPDSAQSSNQTLIYGDRIIIDTEAIGKESKNHNLSVVFSKGTQLSELENLKRGISIATVKKLSTRATSDTSEDALIFNSEEKAIFGFNLATLKFNPVETDINGQSGSGYTTYFLTKAINNGVIVAEQEITATAFTLNYDLYMANLNSLNKRMGELRENNHSQGVWARVFNGALSNDFGLGSKSNYTTIQAGYDYAFGFEGANNYLGVALSYALSTSTSNNYAFDENRQKRGIDGIYSNAVEVALYNSYVSDRGWYNDSIAKFSYIMSKFNINNLNNNTSTSNDTSNFALTLSDEVGYVFKLGESKEWSITPQVEATFGYFNQSNFKQTLVNSSDFLNSSADAVLTLRTRVGSAFGYDFKAFTQKDTFNASLYVGAFYEYDYVSGGEITMSTNYIDKQSNKLSDISSDGRVVMNVGTNMSIKDNTRIYFDFEKSFMGKINTDYQVNVGVRYSFGESDGYSPILEKADYKAPLKIEGEEKEGEESKENKENGEKIEGKESEGEAKSDKTKESKSDKAENTKTEKDLKENMQEQEEAKQTLEKESKTIKNNASKDKTTQRGEKK